MHAATAVYTSEMVCTGKVYIPTYNVGTRVNMDPITAVLVAAIADGAVEVGKSAVAATYNNVTITGGIRIS